MRIGWAGVRAGLALLLWIGLALPAAGAGRAVEGTDFARILPPAGARVEPYSNAGYHLEQRGEEVWVSVEVSALASREPFALPVHSGAKAATEIETLARALTAGAESRYDATSRILAWVARSIRYRLDRREPQDPLAVLARRTAYCTGVARLTVALLAAVEIPAREVSGYVVAATVGPSGYHRWIEVYYPDRGWVFSDPLTSHHYVGASYLRLSSPTLDLERGGEGLLLERRDQIEAADLFPLAPRRVNVRRNSARQLAGTLKVTVPGGEGGTAILVGEGRRRWQPMLPDGNTFLGLAPGSYRLELALSDGRSLYRQIELRAPLRASLSVPATAP